MLDSPTCGGRLVRLNRLAGKVRLHAYTVGREHMRGGQGAGKEWRQNAEALDELIQQVHLIGTSATRRAAAEAQERIAKLLRVNKDMAMGALERLVEASTQVDASISALQAAIRKELAVED